MGNVTEFPPWPGPDYSVLGLQEQSKPFLENISWLSVALDGQSFPLGLFFFPATLALKKMLLKTPHLLQTFLGALAGASGTTARNPTGGGAPTWGLASVSGLSARGPTVAGVTFSQGPHTAYSGQAAALTASPVFLSLVG